MKGAASPSAGATRVGWARLRACTAAMWAGALVVTGAVVLLT